MCKKGRSFSPSDSLMGRKLMGAKGSIFSDLDRQTREQFLWNQRIETERAAKMFAQKQRKNDAKG